MFNDSLSRLEENETDLTCAFEAAKIHSEGKPSLEFSSFQPLR